jgi:hypothetical protein
MVGLTVDKHKNSSATLIKVRCTVPSTTKVTAIYFKASQFTRKGNIFDGEGEGMTPRKEHYKIAQFLYCVRHL